MGDLSEVEIFSRMSDALGAAISHCRALVSDNAHGPSYDALRHELLAVEGCARQASAWREDARWLPIGIMMGECHKRAGNWLRGYAVPGVEGKVYPSRKVFELLAQNLEAIKRQADILKTAATGRVGMILPDMLTAPTRTQGRPSQIILPAGFERAA